MTRVTEPCALVIKRWPFLPTAWLTSARLSVTALMTGLHPRPACAASEVLSAGKALSGGAPRLPHCSVYLLLQLHNLLSVWPRPFLAGRTSIAELESRGGRSGKFNQIQENFPCEMQRFPLPAHWSLRENRGKNLFVWVIHTILRKALGTVLQGVALH